jgi:NDP-sugar pyrophosphorylase family protein
MIEQNATNFIAIVLGAGFGTRLKPLTQLFPKVVCPIQSYPLIGSSLLQFWKYGFRQVHVNTHYLASSVESEIVSFLDAHNIPRQFVRFWFEPEILESGGGIVRIFQELESESNKPLNKDVFVVSGDILAPIPFSEMIKKWSIDSHALMCGLPDTTNRSDAMWVESKSKQVVGFGTSAFSSQNETHSSLEKFVFSNHQIISHNILRKTEMKPLGSVKLIYKPMLDMALRIDFLEYSMPSQWHNVGTFLEYAECLKQLSSLDESNAILSKKKAPGKKFAWSETRKCNLFLPNQNEAFNETTSLSHFLKVEASVRCINEFQASTIHLPIQSTSSISEPLHSICHRLTKHFQFQTNQLENEPISNLQLRDDALFFLIPNPEPIHSNQVSYLYPIELIQAYLDSNFTFNQNFFQTIASIYQNSSVFFVYSTTST